MDETIDVKALRERLGWTQDRMAGYLGLDRSSVSRMESGQDPKGPTLKLLLQLAQETASSADHGDGGAGYSDLAAAESTGDRS